MSLTYQVIPSLQGRNCLALHPETAKQLGIVHQKIGFLRFGVLVTDIEYEQSLAIGVQEIGLSLSCIEQLRLPLSCRYELRMQGNELQIGPFIGILATSSKTKLSQMVKSLSNYLYDYDSIHGAVIACSTEGIDEDRQEISGYLYNPNTKNWEEGTFGYPAALFKRVGVSMRLRRHLRSVLGGRVFNEYVFDKWEMHAWLRDFPSIKPHLPTSLLFQKKQQLANLLDTYQTVYLKPIRGSQGIGIMQVTNAEPGIQIQWIEKDIPHTLTYANVEETETFFQERDAYQKYMIQQGLDLLTINRQKIDFRFIVVKDESGDWKNMVSIARFGTQDSIVSNVSRGGRAVPAADALRQLKQMDENQIYLILQRMELVAREAACRIEECGVHAGNLGIDLALDKDLKIWIIEMNNMDPNHTIALDAGLRPVFYQIKRANMMYAKRLAGFGR